MAHLSFGDVVRDIKAVVLDKDGTIVDFDIAWRSRLARSIRAVTAAASGDEELEQALHRALGSAGANQEILPDGPFVSAKLADKAVMVATVLYQQGMSWHEAQTIAQKQFLSDLTSPPQPHDVEGIGDVVARLRMLKSVGVYIGIATNDERSATLAGLKHLGVSKFVDCLVCNGDFDLAAKPSPDGLVHIARSLGVLPSELAMVGDSVADMLAGKAAGAGITVGVLSGPSTREQLADFADVIVADIHAIVPHE